MTGNMECLMDEQPEQTTQKAKASLAHKKPNSTIAIAADLANDNLNSICRIALAWIADGSVHGISFLIKPPTDDLRSRKVTAEMIANSPSFATVWDTEIKDLIKNDMVSAYYSEKLFSAIKASYEAQGDKNFYMDDIYIRDLKFLASTYIPDLGNDSFLSIMHFMKIPVDLDNALSRAMACVCGIDWLEKLYPVSSYGVPLSAILAGALGPAPAVDEAAQAAAEEAEWKKYAPLVHYSKVLFLPFLILCVFLTVYFMHRYTEVHRNDADFSAYKAAEALTSATVANAVLKPSTDGEYTMKEGTYIIVDHAALGPFIEAMKKDNIDKLHHLLRNGELIVFAQPTRVAVTGNSQPGFVTVKIVEGVYKDKTGITPIVMVNK